MSVHAARTNETTDRELTLYLAPGERIVWKGKPEHDPFVYRTWPLSVFGAVLLISVLAYEITILTTEAPDLLALAGIPFVLVALYMAFGHFLITSREWRNTEYLITDSRVLIRHGALSPTVTTYSLLGLPHTVVEMRGANIGNIMFKPREGQGYGPYPGYQTMWPYTPGYLLGLMYVRDPEKVRGLIEAARKG